MAGYLDTYGVSDGKRERRNRRVLMAVLAACVAGLTLFFFFRNFSEKRAAGHFIDALRSKNYREAYRVWGCAPQTPCRDYAFERFLEDWGPAGQYADAAAANVTNVDSCGAGAVITVEFPNVPPVGIWAERNGSALGFAPWPRCPGRHWNPGGFLKGFFGSPPAPAAPRR